MKWSGNINYLNKILMGFEEQVKALAKTVETLEKRIELLEEKTAKRGPGRPRKEDASTE